MVIGHLISCSGSLKLNGQICCASCWHKADIFLQFFELGGITTHLMTGLVKSEFCFPETLKSARLIHVIYSLMFL